MVILAAMVEKFWETGIKDDERVHVTPLNDLKSHTCARYCRCLPRVIAPDDHLSREIVVHNAFDGREFAEESL